MGITMANTSNIAPSRLLMLYEVSNKINSQLNLKKLLDEIMDQAIALLQAEKGLILFKNDTGDLTVEVARAMNQHNVKNVVAMSHTVIETVDKEGKSVLLQKVPDVQGGSPTESMLLHKLKSIICVPLRSRQQLIGTIYLDTTKTEHFFKEEDLIFLEAFANLAGIAIENARHYQEIANLNANLEKKVEHRTEELRQKNKELTKAYEDLRNTQLQLIRSEKMASLGNLVAGIAHEMNTPLGSLNSNIDLFMRGFEKIKQALQGSQPQAHQKAYQTAESLEELAGTGKIACERISHTVKALRKFARLDEEEFKPVDIHEGIDTTLVLLENKYRDRLKIIKEYRELPEVNCQTAQLNQVFMNILTNACEAIEGEGDIHIRTYLENDQIYIKISDNGAGIPPENLEKIYDPGFTTKGVKVGIGLGLSIGYKIMEDHGGSIQVESKVGKGTTVTIRLPVQ
jgi:signal transduction histidine kinase